MQLGEAAPPSLVDRDKLTQVVEGVLRDEKRLLILDDVWEEDHERALCCCDATVLVTTRIRHLVRGAEEIDVGVLTKPETLAVLLRTGNIEHLISRPPPAAMEIVELCGRQAPLKCSNALTVAHYSQHGALESTK